MRNWERKEKFSFVENTIPNNRDITLNTIINNEKLYDQSIWSACIFDQKVMCCKKGRHFFGGVTRAVQGRCHYLKLRRKTLKSDL